MRIESAQQGHSIPLDILPEYTDEITVPGDEHKPTMVFEVPVLTVAPDRNNDHLTRVGINFSCFLMHCQKASQGPREKQIYPATAEREPDYVF